MLRRSLLLAALLLLLPISSAVLPVGAVVVEGLRPGDVVRDHGIGVVVPGRGRRVYAEQWLRSGGTRQLRITTRMDGSVHARWLGDDTEEAATGTNAGGNGCGDGAYRSNLHRWVVPLQWSFRIGSAPDGLDPLAVESTLVSAARNITSERSPCTDEDEVDAEHMYLGPSLAGTDMTPKGTLCAGFGQRDGLNVVDFGQLPSGVLGMACTWSTLRMEEAPVVAVESDIRLNKHDVGWFTTLTNACGDSYSIEGVMTHEFGHSFGLGHVTEEEHGAQTMSTHINGACQRSEASLGLGDASGLRARY